ncbi:MAG TPA: LysR family transcriptional regulator [Rhodospirillales bacterium]|nr:LysR family transcriptional regulator [Rhodospirillales bacterium]
MKDTLTTGVTLTRRLTVDKDSTIEFMGDDLRVYATPSLVRDVEHACRDMILEHLDEGEDSVGTRVEIDHLAPTLPGQWIEVKTTITDMKGRLVSMTFEVHDQVEQIGRGNHSRFVIDKAKTGQRLVAKKAQVGL